MDLESLTLCAYIFPTTPLSDTEGVAVGEQAICGKWDAGKNTGYGLFINRDGEVEFRLGRGKVERFSHAQNLDAQSLVQGHGQL